MRFIKNEIQTPQYLVPPEKRRTPAFYLLVLGVAVLVVAVAGFFSTFYYQKMIEARWDIAYRRVQTYALAVGGAGILMYIVAALALKVPLRKTTYYKVTTIIRNEPFDPPRKGDFTKAIYARLRDLGDEWAMAAEVRPPDADFVIPQVIIGPGGVFAAHPVNENPERKVFKDPGADMERAAKKLGSAIGQQVTPIIVFATPKLIELYKRDFDVRTRVLHIRDILDFFEKRKNKLNEAQQRAVEEKVLAHIKGTPPGV